MSQQILFVSEDQSLQTFSNFFPADNKHLVAALKDMLASVDSFGCLYLYGQHGAGKTHLLKSAVHALGAKARYLDLAEGSRDLGPQEQGVDLIALDNLEAGTDRESQLMMVFESARQNTGKLLFASAAAPKAIGFVLEDLKSRLGSGQVFEIRALDDSNKVSALRFRAGLRGFELSDEVISYVINRYPRDLNTLFELLDIIDNASLARQRKITVPFIKQLENR